jgi:hypothetical protein
MNPLLFSRLNVDSRWFFAILYAISSFSKRRYIHFCEGRGRRRRLRFGYGRGRFRLTRMVMGRAGCSLLFSICALIVGSVWILNNDYFMVYSIINQRYSTCWVRTNQFCIDVRPEGLGRAWRAD